MSNAKQIIEKYTLPLKEGNEDIQAAVMIRALIGHFKSIKRSQVADLINKAVKEGYIKQSDLKLFVRAASAVRDGFNAYSTDYDGPTF